VQAWLDECNDFGLYRPGDLSLTRPDNHVDLGANAEIVEIDARFNCKASARKESPVIVGFVIVHIDTGAVDLFAQAMAGPMQDLARVARTSQHRRGGAVHLPATQFLARGHGPLDERRRRIASRTDRLKGLHVQIECPTARVPHPRDVGEHRALSVEFGPEIQQDELVRSNRPMRGRGRQVMRVAGIFRSRHVRRRVADQSFFFEPAHHLLLHVVLGRVDARREPTLNFLERAVFDPVQLLRRLPVRFDRGLVPHSRKALNQIAGRHDLDARASHELDRPRVDSRDVRNRALR